MEQTIGKRIAANRKRLAMTQDRLAELVGVSAQAVSKWENDQSCPDIAILPKLAEIFGITTDELLGRESAQTVHQAEVIEEDEQKGSHNWEFHWDAGRRGGLAFALWVLLTGILTLADVFLQWEANFWDMLWPSGFLVFGIFGLLRRFSFFHLGCTLFGGYFLISNLGIWELSVGGEIVLPAILVLLGISLLADALRKPKKPRFSISHNGKNITESKDKMKSHYNTDGETFECSLSFGEREQCITLPRLHGGEINCSFGELTVDLSGCEEIVDGCALDANCSFGELVLMVPRQYRVAPDSSTAFASVCVKGQPDAEPKATIYLDANVSFGEILVKYI